MLKKKDSRTGATLQARFFLDGPKLELIGDLASVKYRYGPCRSPYVLIFLGSSFSLLKASLSIEILDKGADRR